MKNQLSITKVNEGWLWSINEFSVIRCIIDHAISFEIASKDFLITLQFEGDFLYKRKETEQVISTSNLKTIADVLEIINTNTAEIFITSKGDLALRLATGSELWVQPHEAYEAWQLTANRGEIRIVCMPGGELAIWGLDISP